MTTLIFEESINIKKKNFKNLFDFSQYILANFENINLYEASKEELTPEIIKGAKKCRKMKSGEFINI